MHRTDRLHRWAPRIAFVAGVLAAVAFVATGRVAGGERIPPAQAQVTAAGDGRIDVLSRSPLVEADGLAAGGPPVEGRVTLLNRTGADVAVLVRLADRATDLDRALRVELLAGRTTLATGSPRELRSWRRLAPLAAGATGVVTVRVSIPASARDWAARSAELALEFAPGSVAG